MLVKGEVRGKKWVVRENSTFAEWWLCKAECNRDANFLNSIVDQKSGDCYFSFGSSPPPSHKINSKGL